MRTALLLLCAVLTTTAGSQDLPGETVYERCSGAVVQVGVEDDLGRLKGGGSGVVLKDSAWLVTNYHIFEGGGMLLAQKDGKPLHLAGIVRSDAKLDILIIKIIRETFPDLWAKIPDLELALFDAVRPGQRVYTIGSPFGLDNTIADGVLSGKRTDAEMNFRLLQISAAISSGSSGGGVFDARGRLIGISTFVYQPGISQNLNFALAIDEVVEWDRAHTRLDIRASERHPEYVAGLERWKAHDCVGAIGHFSMVPDSDGSRGDALYYKGRCLHQGKSFDQARACYEQALEHDPRIARAHACLATILLSQGDTTDAMEHQLKAYELDPRLRDAKVLVDDW